MLPLGNFNSVEYETIIYPNRTYRLDTERKRIIGYTDDIEAMKQAIYKIIYTERYEYVVYDSNYGIELKDIFGKDRTLACALLELRITEALLADDRIDEVTDFVFSGKKDVVVVSFTAVTNIVGSVDMEVSYNV